MRQATRNEIISYYERQNYDVEITDDGHVIMTPQNQPDDGLVARLEGRWVEEYKFDPELGVVHI